MNDTNDDKTPVTFFFKGVDQANPSPNYNTTGNNRDNSHAYMISQNDVLHVVNNELVKCNTLLRKEVEDKDNEVDNMDERVRYIRGEIKNFVGLRELDKAKCVLMADNCKHNEHILRLNIRYIRILVLLFLANMVISWFVVLLLYYYASLTVVSFVATVTMVMSSTTYTTYIGCDIGYNAYTKCGLHMTKTINCNKSRISEIDKEILTTEASNDFISKYIDSI